LHRYCAGSESFRLGRPKGRPFCFSEILYLLKISRALRFELETYPHPSFSPFIDTFSNLWMTLAQVRCDKLSACATCPCRRSSQYVLVPMPFANARIRSTHLASLPSMKTPEIVVITGASAGVGRATARAFGKRGAKVGLIARGPDGLEAAKREIESEGGEAIVLSLDVSDENAVEQAAGEVERAFGPIDIWVNNAMLSVFSPIMEMTPEDYRRVTDVTYLGYVWGTMAALRRMKPRDRGVIVQVGSALAYRGIPLQSAYCAAKHAVQGFHDSLLTELIHDGSNVRVVMVQMPALNTPQFRWVKSRLPRKAQPVPPIFQPEVAAEAIVWAAYSGRREVNVGWPTTKAIAGNNFAPGFADHYLARNGYDAQMIDEPEEPGRPDNLWAPLPGDHGAHGVFDDRSADVSIEMELNKRRGWILAGAAALGLAALTRCIGAKKASQ
jgi:NAD(P)-dependent dehydrogenase (short-subunit alcohol dehydrogenase family)